MNARMIGLQLRRDRLTMAVWILGTALLALGSVAAVAKEYGAHAEQQTVLQLALANPSVLAFRGAPNGATTGSMLWFELFSWLAVVVGLMNTFFATRHGRADEELGRRELVAAAPLTRSAPLVATLVLGVIANVILGLLLLGVFATAKGVDGTGALAAGATFAVTGLAFLGVGLVVGELAPTSRSANSIGVTVVVAAYVLRAAGDTLGTAHLDALTLDTGWPSWISWTSTCRVPSSSMLVAAPAMPRCRPTTVATGTPRRERPCSTTSAITPTRPNSPSRRGMRKTRSSSPTSIGRVAVTVGNTIASSRGTSL